MKLENYLLKIEDFIKDYLETSKMDGYVLGLSGGVDSTLSALLAINAVGKEKLTCLLMPIDSLEADLNDAMILVKAFNLNSIIIDASETYHQYLKDLEKQGIELDVSTRGNLKARIRMSILYAYAQMKRLLVIGTDNMDERYTGYFTKFGDGAADIYPLVYLTKGEVVEAAKILHAPTVLAERIPSAGLFEGQTDEKEMGITYRDLDRYLLGEEVDEKVKQRIEYLHRISEHKRCEIPTPMPYEREK